MASNNVSAAPDSRLRGSIFAAFDNLPAPLRVALWEAVIRWDPREVRLSLEQRVRAGASLAAAVAAEVADIRAADAREVAEFQYHWPARFGKYPHVAAGASILRDSARTSR